MFTMQARQDGSDASPPRRRPAAPSSSDASPPHRSQAAAGGAEGPRKGEVMQSGANAGLVRGQELKEQLLRKQQVTVCLHFLSSFCRSLSQLCQHLSLLVHIHQTIPSMSNLSNLYLRSLSAHSIASELCHPAALQADRERFAKLDAEKTGRAAKTVYRDKEKGTRLEGGAEELAALQKAKRPKHEKPSWGGGIAQVL